ncbi:unnamed protein product, partial [Iphiclides podalirius]
MFHLSIQQGTSKDRTLPIEETGYFAAPSVKMPRPLRSDWRTGTGKWDPSQKRVPLKHPLRICLSRIGRCDYGLPVPPLLGCFDTPEEVAQGLKRKHH